MRTPAWRRPRALRNFMIAVLAIVVLDGLLVTFVLTRPFWIDEWRIIYNLKSKSAHALWGPLDYLQQFPRLYLSLLKGFTASLDYSYRALRLPSLIVGTCAILLGWRIMRRVYAPGDRLQYLLVMIVVSSLPFTRYYVQVKQYTMDIALCLLAIWQALELLKLATSGPAKPGRYLLLCAGLLLAPFFSYTYPIAIAPAFLLMPIAILRRGTAYAWARLPLCGLPLALCAGGIAVFYAVDVRQLMADTGMKAFWHYNLAGSLDAAGILSNFYTVFAQVGSGYVFQTLFGLLGTAAFLRACAQAAGDLRAGADLSIMGWMRMYAILLLLIVAGLFLAGKLPLGESRLNAFITPSVAILVIDLLHALAARYPRAKAVLAIGAILYIGVIGNIFTTLISNYSDPALRRKQLVYATTGRAIRAARDKSLPILATPGVAFPYEGDKNLPDTSSTIPGDWVLKTHPAYHFADSIGVYAVRDAHAAAAFVNTMTKATGAIFTDGTTVQRLRRR